MSKISVIVPVFKVEKYLTRCVDSILNQTFTDFELILVDDGSSDKSGLICDEYLAKYDFIHVIHKENGGLSDARNAGIEYVLTKNDTNYISFIDSDDYIGEKMLETLYNIISTNNVGLVSCGRYDIIKNELRDGICPQENEIVSSSEMIKRMMERKDCDQSSCDKLYDISLWSNIRFPVGKQNEDILIMNMIVAKAGKVYLCNDKFYHYCHRDNSITTIDFSKKAFDHTFAALSTLKYIKQFFIENTYCTYLFVCRSIKYVKERYMDSSEKVRAENLKMFAETMTDCLCVISKLLSDDIKIGFNNSLGEKEFFAQAISMHMQNLFSFMTFLKDNNERKRYRIIKRRFLFYLNHYKNDAELSYDAIYDYYMTFPIISIFYRLGLKIKSLIKLNNK